MSNQVVPYSEIERMGTAVAKSGLFGVKNPEQAIALMLIAQAEGLHPAIAARDYHVINGRPSRKADAMLARFQTAGGKVEFTEYTDKRVAAIFSHPQGGSVTIDWTLERAKLAELGGNGMWKKYPRQMLRSRVISEGIRTIFPGVVSGIYSTEEVADMEPVRPAPQSVVATIIEQQQPETSDEDRKRWADQAEVFRQTLDLDKNEREIAAIIADLSAQLSTEDQLGVWTMLDAKERRAIKEYIKLDATPVEVAT